MSGEGTIARIIVDGQDPAHNDKRQAIDTSGRAAIQNQPNMDVALSTRATAVNQTNGNQKSIIRGGSKGITTPADITSTSINDDHQGVDVRNWGGGTQGSQQVEGLAPDGSSPQGNPVLIGGYDGTNVKRVETIPGGGRITATLLTADGDPVALGSVPTNPESIKNEFVKNGSNESLVVNGTTPVVFTYSADATHDISLQEIKFVMVASSVNFDGNHFGAITTLTNGLLVEIVSNGETGVVANIKINEDFVHFAGSGDFDWIPSARDMMYAGFIIGGGLKLKAGTSDAVRITVRDNLLTPLSAAILFRCSVKGNLLG